MTLAGPTNRALLMAKLRAELDQLAARVARRTPPMVTARERGRLLYLTRAIAKTRGSRFLT